MRSGRCVMSAIARLPSTFLRTNLSRGNSYGAPPGFGSASGMYWNSSRTLKFEPPFLVPLREPQLTTPGVADSFPVRADVGPALGLVALSSSLWALTWRP